MSVLTLNVDEVMRTLSAESLNPFVIHDKEVDIVRFAINSGFADIVLDGQVALRVMYQRPGETEVRAQTLTYYDTDGLRNYYDWQLLSADLERKGAITCALCILRTDGDVEEWHTTPCQVRVLDTIHTDDSDETDETITPTVAQRVAVLESVIQGMAGGAPVVVGSVSDMTDTGKLYVLTTDNNWYYYDGSAWVAGGEYGAVPTDTTLTQAGMAADAEAVGDEFTNLKSAFDSVFTTTKGKNLFNKSAVLENKYCNVSGVISDYNGRYVTDYIPVESGKIVTSSYLNNASHVQTQATYSAICCYDSTKAVVSGGNINQQTFIVPDGVAFVRITFAPNMYVYNGMVELTDDGVPTAYEPYIAESVSLAEDITIQTDQVIGLESRLATDESNITSIKNDLDGILDTDIIFNQSGFIRYDGTLIANSNYISTDFVDIAVNGTFVKYKYRLKMFANTKIAYYNDSKVFISAISPSESGSVEYVEGEVPYVEGAKYVRFCTASGITDYYVKYATVKNAVIGGANDSNPCNYTGNDMSVFNKILCIGDSLTSGTFNYRVGDTTGNYIEDAKYSYPTYLKKLTGCETVNMGNGGMSSAEWYNAHQNNDLSGYDCAILQLGVNDCIRYTTWGQTSIDAFTNIINKLKTENKNIKIFVANIIPATSYSNAQYLAFSADLLAWAQSAYASDSSVIPLDIQQYGHTEESPAYNCGHLSAYGYWRLAQDYKGYIGWYMNQNKTVFKEVQFIGTDYYYDPIT